MTAVHFQRSRRWATAHFSEPAWPCWGRACWLCWTCVTVLREGMLTVLREGMLTVLSLRDSVEWGMLTVLHPWSSSTEIDPNASTRHHLQATWKCPAPEWCGDTSSCPFNNVSVKTAYCMCKSFVGNWEFVEGRPEVLKVLLCDWNERVKFV